MVGAAREVGRHLLAAYVALHLFAVTFCALPSVGSGMNRSAWSQPTVQGEFRAWSERLTALGWAIGPAELEDTAWSVAQSYESARAKILAPFDAYLRYTGTWQSWKMFVAPHRYPARMEIWIQPRAEAEWEPLYVSRSAEFDWHARWFDHDRFRAALFRYEWSHYGKPRREFATWVGRQAAAEFPEAERIRVSFVRYRTRSPEEVRAGQPAAEKRELEQTRLLRTLR